MENRAPPCTRGTFWRLQPHSPAAGNTRPYWRVQLGKQLGPASTGRLIMGAAAARPCGQGVTVRRAGVAAAAGGETGLCEQGVTGVAAAVGGATAPPPEAAAGGGLRVEVPPAEAAAQAGGEETVGQRREPNTQRGT